MYTCEQARGALEAVDLREGLSVAEVQVRLHQGVRLGDTGQRVLAFYLAEMSDRRLYQATGHSSAARFAQDRLDLSERRAQELIGVGRKLLTLPVIDRAFCEHRIGWSKVLLLTRVASPEHEAEWLARALGMSCRELSLDVRLSRAGAAPREPGSGKGLPEIRFPVRATVGVLTYQKLELAKQKLSAERGMPVDEAELLDVMVELLLSTDDDGRVPGRTPVDGSIYRVVVRSEDGHTGDGAGGSLVVDSEEGPIPVEAAELDEACIRCDAHTDGDVDRKTPPAMRRRVIARDGNRCRCCGSRRRLMAHHIRYRANGGRTQASNLITLCVTCHSLVHADLLVLDGACAETVRFVDATGTPLDKAGACVSSEALLRLSRAELEADVDADIQRQEIVTLESVPEVIDGAWWREHLSLLQLRTRRGVELLPGVSGPAPSDEPCVLVPNERAFEGLFGQDELIDRLDNIARGSRARGRRFPHTLFTGEAGSGKTTLARAIAARCGSRLHETSGPLLHDRYVLVRLLVELREGDTLFIDEVHALPRVVREMLYQVLADGYLTIPMVQGARIRMVRLQLPAFTLVAATSEMHSLSEAFRSRFGLCEDLRLTPHEHLEALIRHAARAQGATLDDEALAGVLRPGADTPRGALQRLERALDVAAAGLAESVCAPA